MLGRRRFIKGTMAAGILAASGELLLLTRTAHARKKGVIRFRGTVKISGMPAKKGMTIAPGDTVTTGPASEVVFVVARNAFKLQENSKFHIPIKGNTKNKKVSLRFLELKKGGLLSVFKRGPKRKIFMTRAVAGVRGTGIYTEVMEDRDYVCTCYGKVEIEALEHPGVKESIKTRHHESPRYIFASGAKTPIEEAPVFNHTDKELIMLEALVGRTPAFAENQGGNY